MENILPWKEIGGGIWEATVTLVFQSDKDEMGFTSETAKDIAKFTYTLKTTGEAEMTLTKVGAVGYAGGKTVDVETEIGIATAVTSVVEDIVILSPYDLNKDGVVDMHDLAAALLYCQFTATDSDWDTLSKVTDKNDDAITAKLCDVNDDGEINILDLLDIYMNFS
jgi:hypothetical protein